MRAMVLKANPMLIDMFSSRRLSLDIQRTTNIIPGQLCCLSWKKPLQRDCEANVQTLPASKEPTPRTRSLKR